MKKGFSGDLDFCSNFYPSPITVYDEVLNRRTNYPDAERIYQAAKFNNPKIRELILNSKSPGESKRIAKFYQSEIISGWFDPDSPSHRRKVMRAVQKLKYEQNPHLKERLIRTKGNLVEYNYWHDNFFGHCTCNKCKDLPKHNYLGKILMRIRDES